MWPGCQGGWRRSLNQIKLDFGGITSTRFLLVASICFSVSLFPAAAQNPARGCEARSQEGGPQLKCRVRFKSRLAQRPFLSSHWIWEETEGGRGYVSYSGTGFCSWLGLVCPQSGSVSGLNDQRPFDPSDSLVEPWTSAAVVLVAGGHRGPRDPGRRCQGTRGQYEDVCSTA